ncbi:MAG: lipocalin family protein [Pseudomonadota bacterium]|nr:lipocalin family protein [Pseudomonadota bacterium]
MTSQRTKLAAAMLLASALAVGGCTSLLSKHAVGNTAVPQPAKPVELSRYLGHWYELARYEQGFQKDCDGVTADYALREDGKVEVINTCRKPDGSIKRATGKAKVVDTATGAKLKVSFFGPFYGDYWVLDHADDYSWSIVGEGSGRYLWLLSRDANPGPVKLEALVERAKAMGYDTSMLRITRQP